MRAFLLLPLSLACLLAFRLPAQTDSLAAKSKNKNHELGMNLYNMSLQAGDFYSDYKRKMYNYVFSGLYYKAYSGKNTLRFSFNYFQKLVTFTNSYNPAPVSRSVQLAAGYQRLFGRKKTAPYIKADLAYEYVMETRMRRYNEDYLYSSYYIAPYTNTYIARSSVASISPGIGLRMHLGKNVVLTAESALDLFYAVENHSYRMLGINARPLQLHLGFMF